MKKFIFLTTLIIGVIISQVSIINVTLAAQQNIAFVIVGGDADFYDKYFYNKVSKIFGKSNNNVTILVGNEVQNKYKNYWNDKHLDTLEEPMPTKTDLIKFVSYGNYDKVIYLIIKDLQKIPSGGVNLGGTVMIDVNVFLVDKEKIITNNNYSEKSSNATMLRAKRDSFEKCIKRVNKDISSMF